MTSNELSSWAAERVLLAAWSGDLTIAEDGALYLGARMATDSEARHSVHLLDTGCLYVRHDRSVVTTDSGERILRRWSQYVPIGGAA